MSRRPKQKFHKDLDPDMGVVIAAEEPREKETITKDDVGEIDLEEGTFRQITERAEESWLDDAIKEEVQQDSLEDDSYNDQVDADYDRLHSSESKPQYGLPATSPMTPKWPTESLIMDWPWGDEPDPQIGEVVGWNWECNQVAVVTTIPMIQGSYPWRVTIEVQQLTEPTLLPLTLNLLLGVVNLLGMDNTVPVIHHPLWYTKWNRAGEMEILIEEAEDKLEQAITTQRVSFHGRYVAVIVSE